METKLLNKNIFILTVLLAVIILAGCEQKTSPQPSTETVNEKAMLIKGEESNLSIEPISIYDATPLAEPITEIEMVFVGRRVDGNTG